MSKAGEATAMLRTPSGLLGSKPCRAEREMRIWAFLASSNGLRKLATLAESEGAELMTEETHAMSSSLTARQLGKEDQQ